MNKILLIFPKLEKHKDFHYVPFGVLKVASKLLHEGHDVKILDQRIVKEFYLNLHQDLKTHKHVMISAFTGYQISQAYQIMKWIKTYDKDIKITIGGPHATAKYDETLACKYVDNVWHGYAERGEHEIPWHLINVNNYINPETNRFIYISSYGCVGKCTFCATKDTKKVIFIPLETIKKDIDNLMQIHKFKECVYFDATIFTIAKRAYFLAEQMKKHNLKWIADARADEICRMPKKMLDDIAKSGLTQLTVGLETGNKRMASFIKKGKNHIEKFKQCARILSEYDITLASGLIFGMPTETLDELKQTIEYVEEIKQINKNFRLSTTFWKALPNTELTEYIKAHYNYKEPETLEGWAKLSQGNHFKYNEWMDNPWIENKKEYHEIYNNFVKNNKEILI